MVEIACVCLSDLHIGAKDSLFTSEPQGGSIKAGLARCLGELAGWHPSTGPQTTIVLAGDVVDLAMASVAVALRGLGELLLSLGSEEPGFRKLVYVPGNHDHHLWTLHRHGELAAAFEASEDDSQVLDRYSTNCSSRRFPVLEPVMRHFQQDLDKHLPTEQRMQPSRASAARQLTIEIAYPNYAIPEDGHEGEERKQVVFTHGHFVDNWYWAGSKLARFFRCGGWPESPEDWDRQNGAWVDYVWSTMGSTGGAGEAVGLVWAALHYPAAIRELLRRRFCPRKKQETASTSSPTAWKMPSTLAAPRGQERYKPKKALGRKQEKKLWEYVKVYLPKDLGGRTTRLATDLTLVFGHTHKPHFRLGFAEKTGIEEGLRVYNTGGWVVDSDRAQRNYGADLVVFDDQYNSAAIRLFREEDDGVDVYTAGADGEELYDVPPTHASYNLVTHLKQVIGGKAWEDLGRTIQEEVTRLIKSHC